MALTTEQRDILLNAKARGLSKQQGMALAFKQTPNQPQGGRFSDAGEDVSSAFKGAGSDLKQRYSNIGQSFLASEQGKQTPIETGAQFAGNVLGAGGDLAFRAAQGVVTPFMKESEERAVQSGVEKVFEPVAEKIAEQSPRTQRNITGALGLFEGVTAGLGTAATKPVTSTVGRLINKLKAVQITYPHHKLLNEHRSKCFSKQMRVLDGKPMTPTFHQQNKKPLQTQH